MGSLPDDAAVVVIGGGLAGLQTAVELDRLGYQGVVVLEAGPAAGTVHINAMDDPEDADRRWLDPGADPHLWRPWTSTAPPHFGADTGLRRRLGGRSLYWQGVTLPIDGWALDGLWPGSVVRELTVGWRGGPALYDRVRADIDRWRGGPDPVLGQPPLRIGGLVFAPVPRATRPVPGGNGTRWAAYTPLDHWSLTDAPPRTTVVTDAEVLAVEPAGGTTRAVVFRFGTDIRRITTETVVLAAGTVQNTRLAIQASAAGDPVNHRRVGLVDHLTQGVTVEFDRPSGVPAEIRTSAEHDSLYVAPGDATTRSNLFVRLYRNRVGSCVLEAWAMGEQLPRSGGCVECAAGPDPAWRTTVAVDFSEDDRRLLDGQRAVLQDLVDAYLRACARPPGPLAFPGLDCWDGPTRGTIPGSDARVTTWRRPLGFEDHESSTLPFGECVTERQELRSARGIFTVGPCVFPRAGAANPSLTTLALAKRLAAILAS